MESMYDLINIDTTEDPGPNFMTKTVFILSLPDTVHIRDMSSNNFPLRHVSSLSRDHKEDCKLTPDGMDFLIEIVTL